MTQQEQLDNWFEYHSSTDVQRSRYAAIRAAGKAFAEAVMIFTPLCADQSAAFRKIREAVMTANASIACSGE